jgi:ABC-type multidrug transport system ATPase subunit
MLRIEDLSRRFDERLVVRSLDVEVAAGERVALSGPNGSGKTTVLRCVVGTLEPSGGTVTLSGRRAGSLAGRALVGSALASERSLYAGLSGRVNLEVFAGLRGARRRAGAREVAALVEELELEDIAARRVEECSTGMLQQLALARALLGRPPVVVLDEPTRSLDQGATARLWGALDRRPELALLIASHSPGDVERCGTRVDLPT